MESLKTRKSKSRNSSFALLFAVILSSIILAVALGVADVSLQEITFGTSAVASNNAFYAADTGAECALYNDKSSVNSFAQAGNVTSIQCALQTIPLTISTVGSEYYWSFILSNLGNINQSCAKVSITKTFLPDTTSIVSKGYNNGGGILGNCTEGPSTVERELDVHY